MIYFSGFSLRDESELFASILSPWQKNPYTVAGFSYGAQKALEYAYGAASRIDRLILISPAWFLDKKEPFIRAQLRAFERDREGYLRRFLAAAAAPSDMDLSPWLYPGSADELADLLRYPWPEEKLRGVVRRGTRIEIWLGGRDAIVDAYAAHDFFKTFGESRLYRSCGHILR